MDEFAQDEFLLDDDVPGMPVDPDEEEEADDDEEKKAVEGDEEEI